MYQEASSTLSSTFKVILIHVGSLAAEHLAGPRP